MVSRILLGRRDDGTFGLDITRPGFAVVSSDPITQPNRFSFSSAWDRLEEIVQAGVFSHTFSSTSQVVYLDVPSGLGYFPMISWHLINADDEFEDEGWYKYNYSGGADPSYSNRIGVLGLTELPGGVPVPTGRVIRFANQADTFGKFAITGTWQIAYIFWAQEVV